MVNCEMLICMASMYMCIYTVVLATYEYMYCGINHLWVDAFVCSCGYVLRYVFTRVKL